MTFFFLPTAAVDKCCIDHWAQPRMGYKNTLKVNKHFSENKLTTAPRHHRFQFLRVTLSYESSYRWQNKLQPSSGSGHKILPYMRAGAWSQLCPLKMQNWDAHSQLKKKGRDFHTRSLTSIANICEHSVSGRDSRPYWTQNYSSTTQQVLSLRQQVHTKSWSTSHWIVQTCCVGTRSMNNCSTTSKLHEAVISQ